MFGWFKKKPETKKSKTDEIVEILFPEMKTETIEGHVCCIDYSIDGNLEAVYSDIIDGKISEQTRNGLKACLEKLVKVREILVDRRKYPTNFEYYIVAANSIDISHDINVREEKPSNEEFRDL